MIISARDPAAMSPEERLAELSEALAFGYLRILVSRKKELEPGPNAEALCGAVDGQETVARKDATCR